MQGVDGRVEIAVLPLQPREFSLESRSSSLVMVFC
jgi:hypothetical protein